MRWADKVSLLVDTEKRIIKEAGYAELERIPKPHIS